MFPTKSLISALPAAYQKPLAVLAQVANEENVPLYVIGGLVRDLLLQRPCKDADVLCVGNGIEVAQAVAKRLQPAPKVNFFKNFGTAQFIYKGVDWEFVGARKESYDRHSRKPIVENGTLQDDQRRRDFTINALAVSLNKADFGELLDPFGGLEDLERKVLRTPLDPAVTFSDDPLRMMRAARFASQLHFQIDPRALQAMAEQAERIHIVSQERVIDELNKIVLSPQPSVGFKILYNTGLLNHIFPEMVALQGAEYIDGVGHKDNFFHTLQVLDNVAKYSGDLWLRWAAILHDIGKPRTKRFEGGGWTFHGHDAVGAAMVPKIFRSLKLPMNETMKKVQKLVALHLRPISLTKENVTDSAIRRLLFDAGDDLEDLMLLCKADITSKNREKVARFLENYEMVQLKLREVEEKDRMRNWQPPVSGDEIMQMFGLRPGKLVGELKTLIREAILDGAIANEKNAAHEFMLSAAAQRGLFPIQQ